MYRPVMKDTSNSEEEIRVARDLVRQYPDIYLSHMQLGIAYEKASRVSEAISEYEIALRMFPLIRGLGYPPQFLAQDEKKACEHFEFLRTGLGWLYESSGRLDDAVDSYIDLLTYVPNAIEAKQSLLQLAGFRLIKVTGVTLDNRQETISHLRVDETVIFRRDPANAYDQYAVRIEDTTGAQIGFVPKEQSEEVTTLLNPMNNLGVGWVHELTGGSPSYPNRGVVVALEISSEQVLQARQRNSKIDANNTDFRDTQYESYKVEDYDQDGDDMTESILKEAEEESKDWWREFGRYVDTD